jgi:translation initiation factor eIF-2B subunit gamma
MWKFLRQLYLIAAKFVQKSTPSGGNGASLDEARNSAVTSTGNLQCLLQHHIIAPSAFKHGTPSNSNGHRCCVYIASKSKYCHRLNSIQAYCDINRDVRIQFWRKSLSLMQQCDIHASTYQTFGLQVVGEANHLSGYSFSAHNNIIHPSVVLGSKTTVSLIWLIHLTNCI